MELPIICIFIGNLMSMKGQGEFSQLMKQMIFFLLITISLSRIEVRASNGMIRTNDTTQLYIAKSFINDLVNKRISDDSLLRKYLCHDTTNVTGHEKQEVIEIYKQQLSDLREKAMHFKWAVVSYYKIPSEDQTLLIGDKDKDKVCAVKFESGDIPPLFLLIEGNKIISFITVHKGEKKQFFVITCI